MNSANEMPEQIIEKAKEVTTVNADDIQPKSTLPDWLQPGMQPKRLGYMATLLASCGHALLILTRRKRLLMAVVIAFLPVLIPVALAFLSQSRFAAIIGVSVRTLQNWEQGRRKPEGPARALLRVVEREPEAVLHALHV